MADDKKKKPKAPKWSTAFIWAAGFWAVAWFVTEKGLGEVISLTFGAFIAGWCTAGMLGKIGRWGAGIYAMMVLGVVIGALFFSGAASGMKLFTLWWSDGASLEDSWADLLAFIKDYEIFLQVAALGLFTGAYVRAQIPAKKK